MRTNLPVTQRQFDFADDATLMSTTDVHSHVTYANAAFIAVSGFEREEVIGQPHNLVRHPDMPREAFADMWETLKAGHSWTALVKNRRKNGDHYWVRANATPIVHGGRLCGYMSVRTKPGVQEVAKAEALYRDFREGRANGRAFRRGLVVRTGLWAWTSALQVMPLRWRIRSALAAGAALAVAVPAALGIGGLPLAAFAGAAALAGALVSGWLERQIVAPLSTVLRQATSVAAGQSSESVHLDRIDEIGMILRAVNQSGFNLRSLVDDVSGQVSGVHHASGEIAQGSHHLSSRTEEAAANLQQTAASMEQMHASVKTNAANAELARNLAGSTRDVAVQGGDAMSKVVSTMQDITASSKRIAEIIGVIDSIAFQTNILALNASVEAARAGDQGRGFAVVASEVRALAQRSADAAKDIKSLIAASVENVESGAHLVSHAGGTMGQIVTQVERVYDLIGQISAATQEQSEGIGQMSSAVTQLDQVTQQNAALVEQSAAAAQSLRDRADHLVGAVKVFQLA